MRPIKLHWLRSIFAGLMSLWMIPFERATSRTSAIWVPSSSTSSTFRGYSGCDAQGSAPPAIITMKGWPSRSSMS